MRIATLCGALSLLVGQWAHAADRPAKPEMRLNIPPYQLNTQVFDFPTGLRILMQSDRSHPVVTTWMIVNHGSKDDPPGKEETAHFVEHTWFRSKHGDLPPIMDLIQDIGARFNATTRNDWTDYRTVASSEYLPLLLRLESLRLTEPYKGVTEEEIDVEREVIRNEWRRRNEQSTAQLLDFLYEAVYPENHGYHDHSTHTSIDNIKLADLQAFMDAYYKPENTTIFVIGDFAPEEAASLIFSNIAPELLHKDLKPEHYFQSPKPGITNPDQNNPDHWQTLAWDPSSDPANPQLFKFVTRPGPRITDERPPVPPVGTTEPLTKKAPLGSSIVKKTVVIGWSLPGGFRSDHWNLLMVGNVASSFITQGFRDEFRQKRLGNMGCGAIPEVLNTTVLCRADIYDSKLDPLQIRDRMLDQLAPIWNMENAQSTVQQTLLTRSKMELMTSLLLNLDVFAQEFGGRGEEMTPQFHYTSSTQPISDGMNQVMNIDLAAVSNLAYEYLKRDRAATVILEPLPEDEIDVTSENSTYRGANVTDQVIRSGDDLSNMTAEQIAESYVSPNMEDLVEFQLSNGMRVVILKHGEAPLVQASLLFGRDFTSEPKGLFDFVSNFTKSIGHDPLPIAAQPQWFVDPGIPGLYPGAGYPLALAGGNTFGNALRLSIQAPSGNLDGALWLMREEIDSAKDYVDRKPAWVKDQRDAVKRQWSNQNWHLENARSQYLYPGSPWLQETTWEDVDVMETFSATTINDYLAKHFQPANATLLILGNVEAEKAKELAKTYFGGWSARPGAPPPPGALKSAAMPTEPSKILIYDDPKRTQTDLNQACRLNLTDPKQEFAVGVLGSLLRNRVFSQMRIKEGLAYSPGAATQISSDGSGVLFFYSDGVVNSGIGRMLSFFKEVVAEVESGNINQEEVTLHKLREARSEGVSAQSLGQLTDKFTQVIRNDQGWETLSNRGELIASVSAEDLKTLVQGCSEHSFTTLEGPKDVIIPQLEELGLPYQVVEWRAEGDELLWKYDPKAAKKKEKQRQKDEKKKNKGKKEEGDDGKPAGHPHS